MTHINNNADDYTNGRVGIYFPGTSNGTGDDGDLTGQCVSLDKWFLAEMTDVPNPFSARGNAKDFGDTLVKQGHATVVASPQRGDIAVWKQDGGGYGHTGVVLSGSRIFEENAGVSGTAHKVVNGSTVYASRIDPISASWRKGSPTYYRVNSYKETTTPASTPAPINSLVGKTVNLSKTATSWKFYRESGPYTDGHQVATLNPSKYGGLSYKILAVPQTDVVAINSPSFGRGAIYIGANTPHTIS